MQSHRKTMARAMQDKTLCRILSRAVERRFGNGANEKWKRMLHAAAFGASLSTILKGRYHV